MPDPSQLRNNTMGRRATKPLIPGVCAICPALASPEWRTCKDETLRHISKQVCNRCGCHKRDHGVYPDPASLAERAKSKQSSKSGTHPRRKRSSSSPTVKPSPIGRESNTMIEVEPSADVVEAAIALVSFKPAIKPQSVLLQLKDFRPAWCFGPYEKPKPHRSRTTSAAVPYPRSVTSSRPATSPKRRPTPLSLEIEVSDEEHPLSALSSSSDEGRYQLRTPRSPTPSLWVSSPTSVSFIQRRHERSQKLSSITVEDVAHLP